MSLKMASATPSQEVPAVSSVDGVNEEGHLAHEPTSLLNWTEFIASKKGMQILGMSHVVADVDGDGDVDIVHGFANANGFRYAEQRNGKFSILKGVDNPFDLGPKVAIQSVDL